MSKHNTDPEKKLIADELGGDALPDDASDVPGFEHIDPAIFDEEFDDEPEPAQYGTIDKIIRIVTGALTMLLLGGSLVFWFIIAKYLIISPYYLADPPQMRALLISCALVPLAATVVMKLLKKPVRAETWLLTMCASGVVVIGIIALIQTKVRGVGMDSSYLPTLICFAISGCALPSMIYLALRTAAERFADWHGELTSRKWSDVRRDVLALTSFRGLH